MARNSASNDKIDDQSSDVQNVHNNDNDSNDQVSELLESIDEVLRLLKNIKPSQISDTVKKIESCFKSYRQ